MTTDDTIPDAEGSATPDADLVLRSRSGDQQAYGELWRRHYRSGIVAARSITSSIDSDDLVQEAYAKILQSIQRGNGPTGSFRAYLFTTIRNIAASWGRAPSAATSDFLDEVEDPESTEAATDEALDRSLTHSAFRSLPTRWQEVLWYTEIEQMKPGEIAPLLGMKAAAVSQLAFRAREGLREAWIQAHIASVDAGSEHAWTIERLGAHTRGNLGARDRAKMDAHLAECARCAIVASEAKEVGSRLALVLLPLAMGAAGATSYLASLQRDEAAYIALAAMPSSVYEGAVVVAGGAVGAGGVVGAAGADGAAKALAGAGAASGSGGGGAATNPAWTIGGIVGAGVAAAAVAGAVLAATLTGGFGGSASEAASSFDDPAQQDASIEASDELMTEAEEVVEPPIATPEPSATPSATPSASPSASPTLAPVPPAAPTAAPTSEPTAEPTPTEPAAPVVPDPVPTASPTASPSPAPTPSASPSPSPSESPAPSEAAAAPIALEDASVVDAARRIVSLELSGEPDETVTVATGEASPVSTVSSARMMSFFTTLSGSLGTASFSDDGLAELQVELTAAQVAEDVDVVVSYTEVEGDALRFTLSAAGVRDPLLAAVAPTPKPSPTATAEPSPTATVTPEPSPTATLTPMPEPTITTTPEPTPTPTPTVTPTPTPTVTPPIETPAPIASLSVEGGTVLDKNAGRVEIEVRGERKYDVAVYVGDSAAPADAVELRGNGSGELEFSLGAGQAVADLPIRVAYTGEGLSELDATTTLGALIDIDDVAIDADIHVDVDPLSIDGATKSANLRISGEPGAIVLISPEESVVESVVTLGDDGEALSTLVLSETEVRSGLMLTVAYTAPHAVGDERTLSVADLGLQSLLDEDLVLGQATRDANEQSFTVLIPVHGEPGALVRASVDGGTSIHVTLDDSGSGELAYAPVLAPDELELAIDSVIAAEYEESSVWGLSASAHLTELGVDGLIPAVTPVEISPISPAAASSSEGDNVTITLPVGGKPGAHVSLFYKGELAADGVFDEDGRSELTFTRGRLALVHDYDLFDDIVEVRYDFAHFGAPLAGSEASPLLMFDVWPELVGPIVFG
ncbi:sigma-70 family RNA polymerase sigma factor [Microbacterium gilvum]|uniref:Sigma-70 family RNA polymerase sigma factor n=1 Tax=Microbacterium gilvum TaxID=1336204 RepID=A0ABP9AIY9_9MICO